MDIHTTVETLFGNQQGGRKGRNTKNRGKKGYRPVLGFIQQSREYLVGSLRKGDTITGKETVALIKKIRISLPDCVRQVLIRADGEFQSWESVQACIHDKLDFIIANKRCNPVSDPAGWYQPKKRHPYQYNSCVYQPKGWHSPCRFVAMRIPLTSTVASDQGAQLALFEDDRDKYRIFCTSLQQKAHAVIREYDKRADVENLVGEAKREGLDAIPSSRFKSNYAYKVETDSNKDKVRYSVQDSRRQALMSFLKYLDKKRSHPRPWAGSVLQAAGG